MHGKTRTGENVIHMMTANTEPLYWRTNKSWYKINSEKDCFELTEAAPQRARDSFKEYTKMQKNTTSHNG
ncbi:MAG: hypothetical protein PHX08_19265 [Lachnospiraceae bacterium]|nr:hypothetical protein [Lachnospiraceae bacterium]